MSVTQDIRVDLAIIGAGWHGLAMAITYHQGFPEASIRIMDSGDSLGGCWAAERIYSGLKTNNVIGSYEFSDLPMRPDRYGVQPGQHIPGDAVHQYLCDAAKHFDVVKFLQLQTKVNSATLLDDGYWTLSYTGTSLPEVGVMVARKLVIATGLTSEPYMPNFAGQEIFHGLILHSKLLKAQSEDLSSAKKVVVVGGNKSAWDVCYSVAHSDGTAHMVIRPEGGGPSWVWPRRFRFFGILTSLPKLTLTRFWTLFDPWPFHDQKDIWSTIRTYLHRSRLGLTLTKAFWGILGAHVRRLNGYSTHLGMERLNPWSSTFWMGNSLSTLNFETDWFELVKSGRIVVHHDSVTSLSEHSVQLASGFVDDVDAFVCCTGWKAVPAIRFCPPEIAQLVGLPQSQSQSEKPSDRDRGNEARGHIIKDRPYLKTPARRVAKEEAYEKLATNRGTPFRLYRWLIPSDRKFVELRNLAFIGVDFSLHTVILAQAQALWITAFFSENIGHLRPSAIDHDQVVYDTILKSEYEKLRRPNIAGGSGEKFPDLVFDSLPYVDLLLRDLGLDAKRKKGMIEDLFTPYGLKDYKGLIKEWKSLIAA